MTIRKPAVSGKFYPSDKHELKNLLDKILYIEKVNINYKLSEHNILGGLVPHAGYMYSAYQAVHFFEILKHSTQKFDTFIIVNPNHTSSGADISLDDNDFWESPFGTIELDKELSELLQFPYSKEAHAYEHSGEVMLPMLQYFIKDEFKILPITMSKQNFYNAQLIASRIHFASVKLNRKICLIASSDFSHYVNPAYGKKQDEKVLKNILNLESEEIFHTVKQNQITMCGYGPAATLCEYAKYISGEAKAELLKFGHSGEINHSDEVVDYASVLVYL